MEATIIEVLKFQRNDAMDTVALVNAHLKQARDEIEALKAELGATRALVADADEPV